MARTNRISRRFAARAKNVSAIYVCRTTLPLAIVVGLLIVLPGTYGLSTSIPPRAHLVAPFTGAKSTAFVGNVTAGCGTFIVTHAPTFLPSTGRGALGAASNTSSCPRWNSSFGNVESSNTQIVLTIPINRSLLPGIFRIQFSVATLATWDVVAGSCSGGLSAGYCSIGAEVSAGGAVYFEDVTTGFDTLGHLHSAATWSGPSNGSSATTNCASGSCSTTTLGTLNASQHLTSRVSLSMLWPRLYAVNPNDSYAVVVSLDGALYVDAYATPGFAWTGESASASVNLSYSIGSITVK